jgi:type I restriction enzyme S subunit
VKNGKALLPKGWQFRRFGECANFINGRAYAQDELLDSGTPVLRIQNLNGGGRWYYTDLKLPDEKYCQTGDLLYAWSASFGPYRYSGPRSVFHYHIWRVITGDELDKDFAFHLLDEITGEIKSAAHGVAMLHMTKGGIEAWQIRLPPLEEQRRIAEVLDRAEALCAKRRAALAELDCLTRSLFLDLFGEPAANPKGWPRVPFGEVGENQDSLRVPVKSADRDRRKGGFAYYGASGIIDWIDEFIFEDERLLIGEDGANLLARATPIAFMARGKYWVNNHAHVIAENGRANLRFLEFLIELSDLKPFISGTAQPKLNRSNLDRILVPLPPIALQHEFARRVAEVEDLKAAQHASLRELEALFAALQHRAFRGQL